MTAICAIAVTIETELVARDDGLYREHFFSTTTLPLPALRRRCRRKRVKPVQPMYPSTPPSLCVRCSAPEAVPYIYPAIVPHTRVLPLAYRSCLVSEVGCQMPKQRKPSRNPNRQQNKTREPPKTAAATAVATARAGGEEDKKARRRLVKSPPGGVVSGRPPPGPESQTPNRTQT
jgi:hypothetical protein